MVAPANVEFGVMHRFTWNGEAMVPLRREAADKAFVIGEKYWLEEVSERSWISHKAEFAFVRSAWENMPYFVAEKFPTPEHLRKAALIATGWFRETTLNADGPAAALKLAAYAKGEDEFAHIRIAGTTVVVRKARSQRMRGPGRMNRADFQASKDDILHWVASLIGVDPEQLRRAA